MADMNAAAHWPVAVSADLQLRYFAGPADRLQVCLEPCDKPGRVSITSSEPGPELGHPHRVRWNDLPGEVLYARCFAVLAVHWFGSIDMTPRIVGAPLWAMLSADFTLDDAESQTLQFQLQSIGHERAALRCRMQRNQPWLTRTVLLATADADPLRALLSHGMEYVRPTLLWQARRTQRQAAERLVSLPMSMPMPMPTAAASAQPMR